MENLAINFVTEPAPALPHADFWRGKRVLITGHTGFKGSWLTLWLRQLGATVVGVALPPLTSPSLFVETGLSAGDGHVGTGEFCSHYVDITDYPALAAVVAQSEPDIIFHLAAQALVHESYRAPQATFAANVMGTVNLLEAVRHLPHAPSAVVCITTDKVYDNREWLYPYRENDALGGHDPYSASKAACEMVIHSYRASFLRNQGVALASARAGNVIGGGDWAAERLVPDLMRAWLRGESVLIRNPLAVRPWQHVLESLCAYLVLAERLCTTTSGVDGRNAYAGAWNFGPAASSQASVGEVIRRAQQHFSRAKVCYTAAPTDWHEAQILTLDTQRARHLLGILPRWHLPQTIARTCAWYQAHAEGQNARDLCLADLRAYTSGENASFSAS